MATGALQHLADFADVCRANEPLAPYTYLKVGGPAEVLAQPQTRGQLSGIVRTCFAKNLPLRLLGGGCNVLVRDEGVEGVVLRLSEPAFTGVTVEGKRVKAGSGAALSAVISESARHGLAGVETLVGVPGTVGGALRRNAGERTDEIGQFVRRVEVLDSDGQFHAREQDELGFGYRSSHLDDAVIVTIELQLEGDAPDAIVKRMRKAWIHRKASQPLSFQAACRPFKNPRGLSAAGLIEKARLAGAKVGGAQVSERDPGYVVAHPGATARDVLRLLDLIRTQVQENFQVDLELDISVW